MQQRSQLRNKHSHIAYFPLFSKRGILVVMPRGRVRKMGVAYRKAPRLNTTPLKLRNSCRVQYGSVSCQHCPVESVWSLLCQHRTVGARARQQHGCAGMSNRCTLESESHSVRTTRAIYKHKRFPKQALDYVNKKSQ